MIVSNAKESGRATGVLGDGEAGRVSPRTMTYSSSGCVTTFTRL